MKKIKKRLILSRHGLRYPLFYHDKIIEKYGKDIVNWEFSKSEMGNLTKKGEVIEHLFGQELKEILGLDGTEDVRFLCNTTKRTFATARLLQVGISPFKSQVIDLENEDFEKLDTRYNILFNNDQLLNLEKVKEVDIRLKELYTRLEELYDLEKGFISNTPTRIYLDDTGYLHVRGALREATDLADLSILKYYENFNYNDIFKSENFMEDLRYISKAKDEFLDMVFGDRKYIEESKQNIYKLVLEEIKRKEDLTIIVGHDSNLACIFEMFDVNYTMNKNMLEKYPIGAKILFEIYDDNTYDMSYIYYHYEDMREIKYSKPIIEKLRSGDLNGRNNISNN